VPELLGTLHAQACNNAWANHRLYKACRALSREEYESKCESFFGSIRLTLEHILEVDRFYIDALKEGGQGRSVRTASGLDSAELLGAAQGESDRELMAFCRGLSLADLDKVVTMEREGYEQYDSALRVLQHLFQHQIHHRGQVHGLLSPTSVAPPQFDEFFLADDLDNRAEFLEAFGLTEADIWR
jgi:uncharacterized damage-inducible protein DinB